MSLNVLHNVDHKKRLLLTLLSLTIVLNLLIFMIVYKNKNAEIKINKIYVDIVEENTNLVLELNEKRAKCSLEKQNDLELKQIKWQNAINKKCVFELKDGKKYVYLKNINNQVTVINYQNWQKKEVYDLKLKDKFLYMPVNGNEKIKFDIKYIGSYDIEFISSNEEIAIVENGYIKSKKAGETTIVVKTKEGLTDTLLVKVSDLFVNPILNNKKKYLTCKKYTTEQATELDEILAYYVNKAGKKTRAGVVAAGKFLTTQFPYRIYYYGESGRLSRKPIVDGEGRYYHEGLYLSTNKYTDIIASKRGVAMWGCNVGGTGYNGLDCSGFITWVLLNGGFDVGDIGAGITKTYDLTDTGKIQYITPELINSNKVKAGDLIGIRGHIAIILGIDSNNYYVGESIDEGVMLTTISKEKLLKKQYFKYIILMDSYYKEQGNYQAMWD